MAAILASTIQFLRKLVGRTTKKNLWHFDVRYASHSFKIFFMQWYVLLQAILFPVAQKDNVILFTCSKDIEEPHDYELSKKEDTFASTATTTVTSTVTSTAASTAANSDDEMSNDKPGYFHLNCSRPLKYEKQSCAVCLKQVLLPIENCFLNYSGDLKSGFWMVNLCLVFEGSGFW